MNGYTVEEKVEIAKRHLLPKQIKEHGITKKDLALDKKTFEKIIEDLNAKKARLYGNPSDSMSIKIFKIEQWLQHRHPGYCQNYEGWGTWEIKKIERD